jgi:hypothetical protein
MKNKSTQQYYEIRVEGHLGKSLSQALAPLRAQHEYGNGEGAYTVLSGTNLDQAALYGVLMRIRDLGLALVSVNRIEKKFQDD